MHLSASRAWHERNRNNPVVIEAQRKRAAAQYSADPERNRQRMRERAKSTHLSDKLAALDRYGGGRCACCGVDDYRFLTFQHANGDGKQHRIDVTGRARGVTSMWLRRLRLAGWPDVPGLTVLCANCHMAEDLWGGCPHAKSLIAGTAGDPAVEALR